VESITPLRGLTQGVGAPVGLPQYRSASARTQAPRSRLRQCLLKGCEQPFRPSQPQQRFCSVACRQQAGQWRRWRSARSYRASEAGQESRRQQACRYRERQRQQRAACWEETLRGIEEQVAREATEAGHEPEEAAQLEPAVPREGQRPAVNPQDFPRQPCQRPGCYVLFPLRPEVPQQRFCSCQCRLALRRVLDREAHWRWRRRRSRRY
jgi:hypothetical protein